MLIWNFWPLPEGGAEKQCRLIARSLNARGISCTIITARVKNNLPEFELIENTPVYRFGKNIETLLRIRDEVSRLLVKPFFQETQDNLLNKINFWIGAPLIITTRRIFIKDILQKSKKWKKNNIVHVFESSWIPGFGDWLSELIGAKTLCRCASWPAWQNLPYDVPWRKTLEKRRLKPFYAVMNSEAKNNLIENGIEKTKCFLVPNGVEIPAGIADVKQNSNVLYIGNFSQGSEWKGFDILIQAWARVVHKVPNAHLVMVGSGDFTPWKRMAKLLGCDGNITWAGETRDPGSSYSQCGIFVLPSRVEGMSNALLEAQSWGLACVVSDIPGNTAVVENNKNGIVFSNEDESELTESIVMLLKNPEMRLKLGKEARREMEKRFALPIVTEKWIQVYKAILQK